MAARWTAPDRILYPETGFTRDDAVAYYRAVAKVLLPHLKNRPVSFKRFPDTIRGESFWEKDAPSFTPSWVKRVAVPRRSGESDIEYVIVNDVRTLTWLASVGGIEIHPFLHRAPRVDEATDVVFDLDPGAGATIADCCRVAEILRDALSAVRLESFVKASGSKGLQVYVPLNSGATHESTERFARLLAEELAKRHSKLIVARMTRSLRAKRVFIDWSQNADYKTTVAVYSLRAKSERPFVSMPLTWDEVERADAEALYFEPAEALRRIAKRGDLWKRALTLKQKLPGAGRSISSKESRLPAVGRRIQAEVETVVNGIRLPKMKSQSGRRLFVLPKTELGDELWLDMHGRFKRWILRADREKGRRLIALPAGDFKIDAAYYRGEVPAQWRKRVTIEDVGSYELIEGSYQRHRFQLFFTGHALAGQWVLEKIAEGKEHKSWALYPVRDET